MLQCSNTLWRIALPRKWSQTLYLGKQTYTILGSDREPAIYKGKSLVSTTEGSLVDKTDLLALNLSGTYCHKTGTRPPSCQAPQQPTIYAMASITCFIFEL